jgi:hypothetical protein
VVSREPGQLVDVNAHALVHRLFARHGGRVLQSAAQRSL